MVLNATFNSISAISWRSVLLVKGTGGPVDIIRSISRLVFNINTCLIFPGNLGMYDSWLSEQVADIPLQVQDGLGHSICV
jgi:hypothetical protein